MRRIVMFNHVSADGYFATPEGSLDWVVPDDELDKASVESSRSTDTILLGRKTYEMFAAFWPHVLDETTTSPDPHDEGRRSEELRAMAVFLNEAKKLVFSRTLQNPTWKGTRVLSEVSPDEIASLKQSPGGDMIVFGSGSLVSALTEHGLIDEYQLVVNPVFLGSGRLLVEAPLQLELVEARPFPSGNVRLRYRPRE